MFAIEQFKDEYRWLSNFHPCDIRFRGKLYPSVEYAYMSAKSEENAWKMMCADAKEKQSKIKKKSQHLELVPNWEEIKIEVMRACLELKFSQDPFKTWLIETGDIHLQEGNTWGDTFWGVDLETGEGHNVLGKLIMAIRRNLQEGPSKFCPLSSKDIGDYFHDLFDIRLPDSFTTDSTLHAYPNNSRETKKKLRNSLNSSAILKNK